MKYSTANVRLEKEDDDIIFVLEKVNIKVPFSTLIMKYRDDAI